MVVGVALASSRILHIFHLTDQPVDKAGRERRRGRDKTKGRNQEEKKWGGSAEKRSREEEAGRREQGGQLVWLHYLVHTLVLYWIGTPFLRRFRNSLFCETTHGCHMMGQ